MTLSLHPMDHALKRALYRTNACPVSVHARRRLPLYTPAHFVSHRTRGERRA
jgi:hypothetical protein